MLLIFSMHRGVFCWQQWAVEVEHWKQNAVSLNLFGLSHVFIVLFIVVATGRHRVAGFPPIQAWTGCENSEMHARLVKIFYCLDGGWL